ncbi:mitochondrial thiamine pyrophosphate carrier-like [Anneissia japonica]|uniref:mitochondrial thiamine pyrophosphate carrier-like n=1 Tax=Anneissia japonica TaxID=1529436 RepID=UPI001425A84D|nr:mitochondrial thiamine pyrophosphate carrier-like [Anneissia japonica]
MVGFDPNKARQLTPFDHAAAGAVSGIVTRAVAQPLDVLKIRFQLQVEPLKLGPGSKYTGLRQAVCRIYQEEGVTAFWKGHVAAQSLSVVFGITQFVSFEFLTKSVFSRLPENLTQPVYKPVYHFFCGGIAGCVSTCVSQPVDVLRTRLVSQGEPKVYKGIRHAVGMMYKEGGIQTFYKGLTPTIIQLFPYTGLQFGFYSFFKTAWNSAISKNNEIGSIASGLCGSAAGFCSKITVYPLDLIKKRLQVQGFEEARKSFGSVQKCSSLLDCICSIARHEGLGAFYKGLSPSLLKAVVTAGLTFSVYEQTCAILSYRHGS